MVICLVLYLFDMNVNGVYNTFFVCRLDLRYIIHYVNFNFVERDGA